MTDHHQYCTGGFLPDDIVISGIAGRFPECETLADLQEAFISQRNLLIETDDRFQKGACDIPFASVGTIKGLEKFDNEFFGFSATTADTTSALLRLLLEVSYEAIYDSGYDPTVELRGKNIGIYTGISNEDGGKLLEFFDGSVSPNLASGYIRCMLANRCSYNLDFHGPSYTVDTACSSSMVALNNAVIDIREGRVEAALVTSGQICSDPFIFNLYYRSGILSPTAESNPFEAKANGIVRTEAIIGFFVQKASEARRSYATITGIQHVAAGHVPEGAYVPSFKEETKLFRTVMKEAGLTTNDIQFIECHGTGTQVGDPIEVRAVETVYCERRDKPLYIGSVKSNLGHSEASAGQSGVIKAIFAFESGIIAPNRNFSRPNENCEALKKGTIKVLTEPMSLTTPHFLVNSFGFGGSIVQVALKRNPITYPSHPVSSELPRLVLYPATTEEAVQHVFDYIESHPELRDEFFALLNKLSFTPSLVKSFRGYALFQNEYPKIQIKNVLREKKREVWYVMTGMGCQWPGMGLEMMQIKVFADSMRKSAAVLKPLGIDLFELLRKDTNHLTTDRRITPAFVSIAAIQIALVDVLSALQIYPDGMVGHSTGEIICAYADGCCTAEQTMLSAYWRGRSVESAGLEIGAMAAVGLTWEETTRRCPKDVYPACHNAEDSVTISGRKDAVEKFVAELQAENVFARVVNAYSYAFHCEKVWPASPSLKAALMDIIPNPQPRTNRWISSSYPEEEWNLEHCRLAGPEYFVHNLMSVARFNDALKKIPSDAITIEIGPHFLLQAILKRTIGSDATYIGLMKRNDDNNVGFLLESLGKLYVEDLNPKIENLYSPVKFPVPRSTPIISDILKWNHTQNWRFTKYKQATSSFSRTFDLEGADRYLLDHRIDGRPLFPATGYVCLAWQALTRKMNKVDEEINVVIEDFKIHRATLLDPCGSVAFEVNILDTDGRFEIIENGSLVSSGKVSEVKNMKFCEPPPVVNKESSTFISATDIYNELRILGYEYGPAFQNLVELNFNGSQGFVDWKENWIPFMDSLLLFFMFCQKSEFVLPTGALSVKVCPKLLKKYVEENLKENNTSIPVNFYASSKICRSVGIEIQNLEVDAAPQHTKSDPCMFEQYRFVPYTCKYFPLKETEDYEKYTIACNKLIDRLEQKMNKNLISGKFPTEQKCDFDMDGYIECVLIENPLLSTLKDLVDMEKGNSTIQQIREVTSRYIQTLGRDIANTLLVNEYALRIIFDIIAENSFKKLNVLEIQNNFTVVLPTVIETLSKCSVSNFKNKCLVCKNDEEVDKSKIADCDIQLFKHEDLPSLTKEKNQGIIISDIYTMTKLDAREHIRLLSSAVEKDGFIVLFHKFCILPPEHILASLSKQSIDIIPKDTLESLFEEEGLVIVSKIFDDVCNSLYLLRHAAEPAPRKIIRIDQDDCWFENFKSSVRESSDVLWVVTENSPDSGIIGMINCLRHEPGGNKIRCVFIPDKSKEKENIPCFSFEEPFYRNILKKDLIMNVYKDGSWGSFRHSQIKKDLPKVEVENSFVTIKKYGDLSTLEWTESALHYIEGPETNIVNIYYSALNFRDVMVATGKLSLKAITTTTNCEKSFIGFECAGRNKFGERIVGISHSRGLGTTTEMIPYTCVKIPDDWSMEEAATVYVVYCTCYAAMIIRGNLRPREKILIHSGTGGVGQAAINIALSMNCEIFTTVGTAEKRKYLMKKFPNLKPENIGCSRDITFENMVMKQTNGKGVDMVLNSLADDKFQASIRCLGEGGRFLEIGKYDISQDHKIGLKFFEKNISFNAVLIDRLLSDPDSYVIRRSQELLEEGFRTGVVKPLDRTVFQRDEVEQAFRYMASGTHIGKVLIKIRDEEKNRITVPERLRLPAVPVTYFYPHKVYVIVGGLGGFGIEVCKWLLAKGAKNLVLTSRYGARTPYHHFCLMRWKNEGYNVTVSTKNVSIKDEAAKLLKDIAKIGPVGGIFNSAVVLNDAFFEHLDLDSFKEVCAPKAEATKNLDTLSRCLCPELDHFVCFSSISCGRGNACQMNYGYANSVMERVCEMRRAAGLPGLAIQWGIIGDVGVVHRHMGDDAMIAGICAQRVKSCLDILNIACKQKYPVVTSYVIRDYSSKAGDKGDVLQQLARIFGFKDASEFNSIRSFGEMGLDSMIGVEVKHLLETTCDVSFAVQEIQELKLDDIKAILEKAEKQKKDDSPALFTTTSAVMPNSIVHPEPVTPLNDVKKGIPVFILDVDGSDMKQLRSLGTALKTSAFALLLTKETPTIDVPSIAGWFLQKIRDITQKEVHLVAHKTSGLIALEMVLQSQKTKNKISKLTVLDGVNSLMETINRETKQSDVEILCDFVEQYIPSSRNRLKDQLSNVTKFDQMLRLVVELFTKSSKESVNKNELTNIITSHIQKLQLLQVYKPKEKLNSDFLVIEDSSKFLANDVAVVKQLLTEICNGKVNIQRIPDISKFTEDSIQKIAGMLCSE